MKVAVSPSAPLSFFLVKAKIPFSDAERNFCTKAKEKSVLKSSRNCIKFKYYADFMLWMYNCCSTSFVGQISEWETWNFLKLFLNLFSFPRSLKRLSVCESPFDEAYNSVEVLSSTQPLFRIAPQMSHAVAEFRVILCCVKMEKAFMSLSIQALILS